MAIGKEEGSGMRARKMQEGRWVKTIVWMDKLAFFFFSAPYLQSHEYMHGFKRGEGGHMDIT